MHKIIATIFFLVISFHHLIAQVKADDIIGVWQTSGKEPAKIRIHVSGERYFGEIIWLQYPEENGKPKVDINNSDKNRRHQPIVGLVILNAFKFDGGDNWEDGKIYDPENGKTYRCTLSLKDKNTLNVRGYIGITLFGRTETWQRVE